VGVWGTGIFADDNAADLRDDYRTLIGDGVPAGDATDRLIAQWSPQGDPDLEPVFWLSLALTQWNCGRLEDRVKEQALRVIADGSAMRPWLGGPDARKRISVLEAARRKIESPQPAVRKIKKRVLATCDWERGELIAYRMLNGEYVVLRVLDLHVDQGGACPNCELLDWHGAELPAQGLPDTTPVRDQRDYGGGKRFMILPSGKRFLMDRLRRLNVRHVLDENYSRVPRGYPNPTRVTSWTDFDQLLETSYGLSGRET
jgi:hypothetical protein